MAETCSTCRFSKSFGPRLACRRYPPTVAADRSATAAFPCVLPMEWCGEWLAMRPGADLPAAIAPGPVRGTGRTVRSYVGGKGL